MLHDCFKGIRLQEMTHMVGNRTLAFNLLMPDQGKTRENEISGVFLGVVSVTVVYAFLIPNLDPIDAWKLVIWDWPFLLIGMFGFGHMFMTNREKGLIVLRPSLLHPSGNMFWMFLITLDVALILSGIRSAGFLHDLFLLFSFGFAALIIWLAITIENAYVCKSQRYDRFKWLVLQIPKEEVRHVVQNHHGLDGQVKYQHDYYPVPPWSDEEIDNLIEKSWRKRKAIPYENLLETMLLASFFLSVGSIGGIPANGYARSFGKETSHLGYFFMEVAIIGIILIATFVVFVQHLSFIFSLETVFIHIVLIFIWFFISNGINNFMVFLLIMDVFILWQGVKNSRGNHDQRLIDRYKKERISLEIKHGKMHKLN